MSGKAASGAGANARYICAGVHGTRLHIGLPQSITRNRFSVDANVLTPLRVPHSIADLIYTCMIDSALVSSHA